MYQIFFSKDGQRQHAVNRFTHLQYWNDACWHASIPEDARGLTYLDVGSHAGYFCLRFEQRGGVATGLDYSFAKIIDDESESPFTVGEEHTDADYLWVKKEYNPRYKVLVGGFGRDGKIVPVVKRPNIISAMNVLEYLPNPKDCIQEMFAQATDRVLINLDVNPHGPTKKIDDLPPMKWLCGLDDVLNWCPWPHVHWLYDIGESEGHSRYQLFLTAMRPDFLIDPVKELNFDPNCDLPQTEKFYRTHK